MSNTGSQGLTAYGWPNSSVPSVPSQTGLSSNAPSNPHMYQNTASAYTSSNYPTARGLPMHPQQTGMLPQQTHHLSAIPANSSVHPTMYINANSGESGGTGIYQCPQCPAQFDRAGRYEAHLNGHRDFKPYVCDGSCGTNDWYVKCRGFLVSLC